MAHLAVAQLLRRLRLQQVVDARRTAAQRSFRDLRNLQLRNASEQLPRLLMDTLRVTQMAGIVVRNAQRQRVARPPGD